ATVCDLLRHPKVRLVTLTGPGGIGKTRLGFQVAAELLDDFVHGVFFVNLAPIRDPNLVASVVAQTLGLSETGDQPLQERLQYYLRNKQLLLLLDNFEQVTDAAPLVAELLSSCPKVKILVTSRVSLHLRGEQEFAVPPLALPDLQRLPDLAVLSQYAAVALFIQRACAIQPDFAVTNATAPAVAEICHRLDGLPLAIELAAMRVKLLPLPALLARLDNRLKLLTGGARDLPARQQTIRATIAWSYDLLELDTQPLFRRLAVFVGGCTLEAVAAVCNASGDLPLDVLDGLATLVDTSLLRQEEGADGESRFVMLETIHEYAIEQLAASGEAVAINRLHAEHYLALAEAAYAHLTGAEQALWLNRLEREHDNLRAAVGWTVESGEIELELRLIATIWRLWEIHGYWSEGRAWLDRVLVRSSASEHTPAQAKAQLGAGVLALRHGSNTAISALQFAHRPDRIRKPFIACSVSCKL
ncbi:MAG: NB-ARC domain-containing protein, partial [Chloroflexota bacterium]|nr:NB-ARC domain-containing protein [Chloroflexota bacterium]